MAKKAIGGGRGVLGITFSGKTQDRVPATRSEAAPRNKATSVTGGLGIKPYMAKGPANAYRTGMATPGADRNTMYGSTPRKSVPLPPAPISTAIPPKPKTRPAPAVIRTTTNMRATPASAPARGGGLGVSTGKTTGTTATRAGTGGKTVTSAYDKQMANALNRTNQPAGPTGKKATMSNRNAMGSTGSTGSTGSKAMGNKNGGGGGSKGGSLSGQGSGARTAGVSRTGGTRQNNPVRG